MAALFEETCCMIILNWRFLVSCFTLSIRYAMYHENNIRENFGFRYALAFAPMSRFVGNCFYIFEVG